MKSVILKYLLLIAGGALAGGLLGWLMRCAGNG